MAQHEIYMKRCIKIAENALGSSRPNPMVGCVIVYKNKIIGEGFTSPYGGHHAEVNAINSVQDKSLLKTATLYVTLEPCSHFGKTPPCSDLIIKHQIPNIIIGTKDNNSKVAGKGIKRLKNSGASVIVGVLEDECKKHHKRFFTFQNKKRPYIILKWAETIDGYMSPKSKIEKKPVWITNEISRQLVHKWRAEEQAILVGAQTVLQDNPSLTVRDWTGQNPVRVVIDKEQNLPKKETIFNDEAETLIISKNDINFSNNVAQQICNILYKKAINSIIIEGGSKTLQMFIDENIWDEARVFIGQIQFNDGVKAPLFSGQLVSEIKIIDDELNIYMND